MERSLFSEEYDIFRRNFRQFVEARVVPQQPFPNVKIDLSVVHPEFLQVPSFEQHLRSVHVDEVV